MRLRLYCRETTSARRWERWLKWLGTSWARTPARRLCQTLSLCLFGVLLFHVICTCGELEPAKVLEERGLSVPQLFLYLDPLVSISTALASGAWIPALGWAGALLALNLFLPRVFCGYLCPLGSCIDLADRAQSRRSVKLRLKPTAAWASARFALLLVVLLAAATGTLVAGYLAPMPLLTRALACLSSPLQLLSTAGPEAFPPLNGGQFVAVALLIGILALSLSGARVWCRCLCPSGALFSIGLLPRLLQRQVSAACDGCGRCARTCTFEGIRADFSTRGLNCAFCQECASVCPREAIHFTWRWRARVNPAPQFAPIPAPSRRGFLGGMAAGAAAVLVVRHAPLASAESMPFVRPPGSLPEAQFLTQCVRCSECIRACPSGTLQPVGFQGSLDALWTPMAAGDYAGCHPACHNCGQVCPTGAIRALPLEEKNAARMGLVVLDEQACLPLRQRQQCQACVDACQAAGFVALTQDVIAAELDANDQPIAGTGFWIPVLEPRLCLGCLNCQVACYATHVRGTGLLQASAIRVVTGPGKEDRIVSGSYLELRAAEAAKAEEQLEN